jgi:hypothetical protein
LLFEKRFGIETVQKFGPTSCGVLCSNMDTVFKKKNVKLIEGVQIKPTVINKMIKGGSYEYRKKTATFVNYGNKTIAARFDRGA